MKNFLNLILLAALLVSPVAHGYVSSGSGDPINSTFVDTEYKTAYKSETAVYSDAITRGHGLYYDVLNTPAGGYSVTRNYTGTGINQVSANLIACIARRDVASGDVAAFPCVNKGYVDFAKYDATSPFVIGGFLCVGTAASVKGVLIGCDANIVSPIVSLQTKASGTGSDLKVIVNGR